jgi:hypothetical protein
MLGHMSLPNLNAAQIEGIITQVAEHIEQERQTYRPQATPLDKSQKALMAPFFPQSVLESTRVVVLSGQQVSNPPFYGDLVGMGFPLGSLPDFSDMGAITFVDTIVSHGPITNQTLFHELVHAVQYEKLGLPQFAAKYVKGFLAGGSYNAIPLERNAYELDERFAGAPRDAFSVQDEVEDWAFLDLF